MATKQEKLLAEDTRIQAFIGRYEPETIKDYEDMLVNLKDQILAQVEMLPESVSRTRLLAINEQIDNEIIRIQQQTTVSMQGDVTRVSTLQYEATYNMMNDFFPRPAAVSPVFTTIPTTAVINIVDPKFKFTVMNDSKTKKSVTRSYNPAEEIEKITNLTGDFYKKQVASAVVTGKSIPNIMQDLKTALDSYTSKSITQVEAITRTTVARGMELARKEAYQNFDDVIKGWMWNSVLDNRTTLGCALLSGRVEKYKSKFPPIPRHIRCRSILTAITDFTDIENISKRYHIRNKNTVNHRDGTKSTKFTNADTGVKTIKNPPQKNTSLFDVWFDSMPDDTIKKNGKTIKWKQEYLGKEAYELYKAGKVKPSDLVNKRTLKPLTLAQIKANI